MMRRGVRTVSVAILFSAVLGVSACDSSEERAEEHFKSAMALVEKGDLDRAVVEFRNVFKLNANHHDARMAFAKIQRERGLAKEAFAQYRKVVEQFPEDQEALIAMSEISLESGNWEELERRVPQLLTLAPDNLSVQSMDIALKYFIASRDRDDAARGAASAKARELLAVDPSLVYPRRVVIDDLGREQKWTEAIDQLDEALAFTPDDLNLLQIKLSFLQQIGDFSAMQTLLEDMAKRFPENERIRQTLISFYVGRKDLGGADGLLKADAEASTDPAVSMRYVSYLFQYRGVDAAMAELERIIAAGRLSPVPFQTALARMKFDAGKADEAIASLEAIAANGERNADMRNLETDLARMMFLRGNSVGARQLVERVLAEDSAHPGASKLKASWLIQDDETADAILLLRDALAKAPQDSGLLILLAQAYEREGKHELVGDMLAQAVEVANKAPDESLRYARFLAAKGQNLAAEQALIDALRVDPTNRQLLVALGTLYTQMKSWAQADGVVRRLKSFGTPETDTMAAGLEAQILENQERKDELLSLLEGLSSDPTNAGKVAQLAIFRTRLETNGPDDALKYLDELMADSPNDPELRFLRAGTLTVMGKREEGEAIYRSLIDEFPQSDRVWLTLYRIALSDNDLAKASNVIKEGLSKLPDSPSLLLARAEELQRDGKIEEAIGIYEKLYERDTSSSVIANNLASLMADYRSDDESLQRAFSVARRLRGSEVPSFQDTYGWIAHRLGNHAEALPYLEGAAKGLENDVTVQYHFAVSLAANGEDARALEQFKKTQSLIDPANPPAFAADIESEIARLGSAVTEAPKN